MKAHPYFSHFVALAAVALFAAGQTASAASAAKPYTILNSTQTMGNGGIDYVYADSDGRSLYVPRGSEVLTFNLDTLKQTASISNARARGVAVDPKSHHGFCSSRPVVMWDTKTMATIKTIDVQGNPDGILFEPQSECIYVFSHSAPNATVINAKDGTVVGTIDLGGQPEQAQSDGKGHLYADLEDKDSIAVVDVKTRKLTATYSLGGKGGGPGGLGLDIKNHLLFAMCHTPQTCVILDANDGKIVATLPIGNGTDGGGFDAKTMEAFSSQRDGTLTIIKENSPTSFEVEQTVQTRQGGKTCTLDTKNNHIIVIATEAAPAAAPAAAPIAPPAAGGDQPAAQPGGRRGGGRGRGGFGGGPGYLDILVIGR